MASSPRDARRGGKPGGGHAAFGTKDISAWGSFVFNFNNATGPALVCLPLCVQQAGWVFPLFLLWFIAACSGVVAMMLCEAMQRIPGNHKLTQRYEYCTMVKHYMGNRWYMFTTVMYNLSLLATNVAAIVITAQVMDNCIFHVCRGTYGLDYGTFPPTFVHAVEKGSGGTAGTVHWSSGGDNVVSLGFLVISALIVPIGAMNLDESMWLQWLSFGSLVLFTSAFIVQFVQDAAANIQDINELAPPVTDLMGQIPVLGVVLFANAYMVTIPSWVNEKAPNVSVTKATWLPAGAAALLSSIFAITGAWAYKLLEFPDGVHGKDRGHPKDGAGDVLNYVLGPGSSWWMFMCGYLWSLTVLVPGIPILAIVVRYNLQSGGASRSFAFILSSVLPVLVTAFLYERGILQGLCQWVAVFLQGLINFVLPPILYRKAIIRYGTGHPGERLMRPPPHPHDAVDGEEDAAKDLESEGLLLLHPAGHPSFSNNIDGMGAASATGGDARHPGHRTSDVDGEALVGSAPQSLPADGQWDSISAPLLAHTDGLEGDEHRQVEIQAVPSWIGVSKLAFADGLAWMLGGLCTLAVILTLCGAISDADTADKGGFQ
eukprot:evm.model.scf_558EXC.6 EVM.evm.TU.scf_558EXC.6   scf_558EXC:45309-52753(+)